MHPSALNNCECFFQRYAQYKENHSTVHVIDVGAQDVNGSLRDVCPAQFEYIGVDFVAGKNVDVVLNDPYVLPFADESIDIVVTSSCLEHSEMFWLLFLEMLRILKPNGLAYLNAPSNGCFHRYPVDCWRFFPDSGKALVTWAKYSGFNPELLESFVSLQKINPWNDFVAVFVKDEACAHIYPERMLTGRTDIENSFVSTTNELSNFTANTEDLRMISSMTNKLNKLKMILND